ncbi:MAG: flagellar basal-body MS-ring/collar protein FliF [Deltaproteobacteria bacterium]|nr:flagellar basal-body MS-ring/collar protein FliF [Deltaproteobacteria bacterium]
MVILEKLWQGFSTLSASRKMTLAGVTVLIIASLSAFVYFTNQEDYRILFSNLNSEDASNIVTKLKEKKIPYQISPSDDIISVPSGKVAELRLELAAAGLPHGGGVGFEIFDNKTLGATEFEQQLNYRRALQGELARTINSLDEIQQSRVHIALPKESLFIDQQKKPTASVTLKLKTGRKLKPSQIEGIGHLVASSIEGLSPDNVMIVDSQGNMLSKGQEESRLSRLSSSQIDYQRSIEKDMGNQIQTLLENVVGQGKAVVRVNADLDFRITEKTEETYDPESPVVRSTQKQMDKMTGPVPAAAKASGKAIASGAEKEKTDETVNYEINKTISKTVMPVGEIKKISIAVLVDGIYTKDDKGTATFQERPKKELESLEDLVRKSSGFNAQRGDQVIVTSMPFNRTDLEQGMTGLPWQDKIASALPVIKYVVILVAIVLVFLFVIRPLVRNVITASRSMDGSMQRQLPSESAVSVEWSGKPPPLALSQLEDKPLGEMDMAKQLAGANAKKFAELLRNWLK